MAWHALKRDLPTVKHYASAILYHNYDEECRAPLSRVLEKTKYGDVKDIIIKG